ncbi:hypothetical protein GCM10011529_17230 [Polymorphobacter glacialis]|uniref:Uncharacterized protein n=1 Tax=Sandarakinorhabdus glacialis TaxID=1614636 RepID=A0A917E8M0_9SPHN|nr:hypothetical protein [Polymorphobacter glacialis]GGE11474.1 hypothetical protein GCM10011529_17230 [Polymorphobacter glacialis]
MANETIYGRYVIRSMKASGGWNTRAFRGNIAMGVVLSGATEETAILATKAALDAIHTEQRAARGAEGYPTARFEQRWRQSALRTVRPICSTRTCLQSTTS